MSFSPVGLIVFLIFTYMERERDRVKKREKGQLLVLMCTVRESVFNEDCKQKGTFFFWNSTLLIS